METLRKKQKQLMWWFWNSTFIFVLILAIAPELSFAQCLSSVNPVGGTNNMLVLEKNSLRVITFYKYGGGDQYFKGTEHYDEDVSISKAYYNYLATTIGYGVTNKLTLELETGYFFNKTQVYDSDILGDYKLTGKGLSNLVILAKHSLFTEPVKRIYITGAVGAKIPSSRTPQSVDNVELPPEIQPTMGAFGGVLNFSFVKESPENGLRYFFISRAETNGTNKNEYKLGNSFYNSVYVSKHLMFPWLKGDWTTILQLRNEIRLQDKIDNETKQSSGSNLFFITPQINHFIKEKWNVSALVDIPVYQNFKGTQLGAHMGFTFVISRTFRL